MTREELERDFYGLVLNKPQEQSPETIDTAIELLSKDLLRSLITGELPLRKS